MQTLIVSLMVVRSIPRRPSGTKIHALVDALGNPVGLCLNGGQARDPIGADRLLPSMRVDILIAEGLR